MRRRLVVELLGPPGSGKSTLAAALGASPDVVVVNKHGMDDALALTTAAVRAGRMLAHPWPPTVRPARQAAWVTRLGAAEAVVARRARAATTVVLDQGPAYTLGRLDHLRQTPRGRGWWLRQAARTADLLDLLVLLDADVETLVQRIRDRDKAHVARSLPPQELAAYLHHERASCRTLADCLGRHGVPRLDLDMTGEPSAEVAEVLGALRCLCEHGEG